ncbi:N(6)-adenine-specific methyltransferase METTL4 [Rhipicephalus sanguineus]|uniref:N(6)-adenine-specific methyltransferase METTL4 n=1 Tax=Rhipicephalus sanguineus TaxID=34632 RepID=UPI0018934663|nr:N(6)-adenine-specific methyltransferase METTL4 [Rhipicephalus sanguineus]
MAVLLDCDCGSFISHNKLVESWYRNCRRSEIGDVVSMKLKDALFDVRTPMRMDSAAEKLVAGTKHRKRKWRSSDDTPLTDFVKSCSWIAEASDRIVRAALDAGHLEPGPASDREVLENNRGARAAAADALAATSGVGACLSSPVGVHCSAPHARLIEFRGLPVWLPANARAQIGDVRDLGPFLTGSFDFVLLDPPWENKSARRKRAYSTLPRDELLSSLPLPRLASPRGCLVAVWCTTNGAHLRFVARELLPSWGLTYLATWYWVKVTKHGEPVRPFDCPHKKPYEFVIFGGPSSVSIPRDKVFVSVPSCVHSHKPPLTELVRPFVKNGGVCMEVFARYLVPGWTSVGNEALKLQHESLYEPASLESPLS